MKIAGAYWASWNGIYIGTTMEGFTQNDTIHSEEIRTSDFGGPRGAMADAIILGQSATVELDYAEYDRIAQSLLVDGTEGGANALFNAANPYRPDTAGHPENRVYYANRSVGMLATAFAKPLVLVKQGAEVAMPAGLNATPRVRKYYWALPLGNFRTLLQAGLRHGPVSFQVFPYNDPQPIISSAGGTITFGNANYGKLYEDNPTA